jgi:hypothetical protein
MKKIKGKDIVHVVFPLINKMIIMDKKELIKTIRGLVIDNPNDFDLGGEIRKLIKDIDNGVPTYQRL